MDLLHFCGLCPRRVLKYSALGQKIGGKIKKRSEAVD